MQVRIHARTQAFAFPHPVHFPATDVNNGRLVLHGPEGMGRVLTGDRGASVAVVKEVSGSGAPVDNARWKVAAGSCPQVAVYRRGTASTAIAATAS